MTINTADLPLSDFRFVENDELKMQLGFGLSLFMQRPFEDTRAGVYRLWRSYLDLIGGNNLTWARLGGGNRSRDVNSAVLKTIDAWLLGQKKVWRRLLDLDQ